MFRSDYGISQRRDWLGVLARAEFSDLADRLAKDDPLPAFSLLRGPELGLTMIRARVGGTGEVFNFIEATISRASIHDADGHTGHGYVLGRGTDHALAVARLDAALQDPARQDGLLARVVTPRARAEAGRQAEIEARAAGTEVRFFTMGTGHS